MRGEVRSRHRFEYRGTRFEIRVLDNGALELCLDGVVRKRRLPSRREPMYLWTNVELQWEEHHYVEARYWSSRDHLLITVNGDAIHDGLLRAVPGN